ncbi:MAG: 16S rRNA (adenine(1518)-N(6)/adenine(1519)-N(6))-dimethyltransferase RsmA [Bacteroidota bacterium]
MKYTVKPKKYLGQHFLNDESIAETIVETFINHNPCRNILEVGPGMGVLTKYLLAKEDYNFKVIEIDAEAINYINDHFPALKGKIIYGDILKFNPAEHFDDKFSIIGNFPYNISSQILFMILENKERIPFTVGMFQKEVGDRIAAPPGSKTYGILSVLMQAYYDVRMEMIVEKESFNPPPQVRSVILSFTRKVDSKLKCDELFFFKIVKIAFNQRRKTLRNAIKSIINTTSDAIPYLDLRAERLSWQMFEELTSAIELHNRTLESKT